MTTKLDLSDLAVFLGLVLLGAGLLWTHPGLLVAFVGVVVVGASVSRPT